MVCLKDQYGKRQVVLSTMEHLSAAHLISEEVDEPSDEQERDLIKRCQNGNSQAMEQIVRQYQNQVYNIAYGILGNPEDAQDIAQDAFLSVWEKIGQFRFKSRFSTWLYRIVTNLCINERNRQRRRQTSPMEMNDSQAWTPVDSVTPEKEVLLAEQQELLQAALAQLKEDYRNILILREMENLSYDELAEVLNCSVGRVKSRLHEARTILRKILKQKDW
jgi:RNA polymerase sigma-70 factor (ECF subfamily)